MSSLRRSWWYRVLAAWLCALLVVSGVPAVPVQAEELGLIDEPALVAAGGDDGGAIDDANDGESGEGLVGVSGAPGELEGADEGATLSHELHVEDGPTYWVSLAYDGQADIPREAQLLVRLLDDGDDAAGEGAAASAGDAAGEAELRVAREGDVASEGDADTASDAKLRAARTVEVLSLGADDRILETTYLDIRIVAGGQFVQPASDVTLTIETDAIDPAQAATYELVHLADEAEPAPEPPHTYADEALALDNLTPDEADAPTKLAWVTDRLGTFALASVVTQTERTDDAGLATTVLLPRKRLAAASDDAAPTEGAQATVRTKMQLGEDLPMRAGGPDGQTATQAVEEGAPDGDAGSSIPLSSTFLVRASAKTYARSGTVTFVDENKHPIMGTVMGTRNVNYTGGGAESNADNTLDMYSFVDKLDPEILDEYDFSRVFVQLTATDEKDFRYIQVGDGSAIGQSASIYRAYFNLEGIEQNESGKDYHGTWYQLNYSGPIDNIYIEFYHVAPASFYALDARNDPVEDAEFSLYLDPDCYVPLEYKNQEIRAVSDRRGLVSFGKVPQGIYYMKETGTPEGYQKTTDIYTVVVDGETPIDNVIHQDDDGSVIITDVLRMTLTKVWDDGRDHATDSVDVAVYARGEVVEEVTLSADNDWTTTLDGLDPNEPYMVSETCVRSGGADVTNNWIPTITYEERDPHAEYYKADDFKKDKQYVLVTTTSGGTRALLGNTSLTTTPLAVSGDKVQIVGAVSDDMVWNVDTITKDGVLALKNVASGKYLNQDGKWLLDSEYPEPLYVRHINDDGIVRFYHRPNLNSASAYYLYIWYSRGSKAEGTVDRYRDDASKAATFDIYRKVNVRSVDVTIANKGARYPIQIRNLVYPNGTPLPGATFDLYTQQAYETGALGTPYFSGLTAGTDGYLRDGENVQLELGAGTYYLCQASGPTDEGFLPVAPLKFLITRGGALRVSSEDQPIAGFAYRSSIEVGDATLPVLQVPNVKAGSVEVTLTVAGSLADPTRAFEFSLAIPEGLTELHAKVDGEDVVLTPEQNTFVLSDGQTLLLEDVPATVDYVLTQTSEAVARGADEAGAKYVPTCVAETQEMVRAEMAEDDWRVVTISGIGGTTADPARVRITNTLGESAVLATGVDDNVLVWLGVVVGAGLGLAALFVRRRRRGAARR